MNLAREAQRMRRTEENDGGDTGRTRENTAGTREVTRGEGWGHGERGGGTRCER